MKVRRAMSAQARARLRRLCAVHRADPVRAAGARGVLAQPDRQVPGLSGCWAWRSPVSWGYAGILNLGQGLFFGLGAYMTAMSLKLASPTSLQQGSATPVPDFMLWNAEPGAKTDLCCINHGSFLWMPFQNQWFGIAMSLLVPVLVALGIGWVMFRKRISGVFVSIIMLALVLLVRLVVIDAQPMTNGFNGLTDLGDLVVFGGRPRSLLRSSPTTSWPGRWRWC